MADATVTNVSLNSATISNTGISARSTTWGDANYTWGEGAGTWGIPYSMGNVTKNTASITNESES